MKLDGEQVFCHVTIDTKPGAKAFEHKDIDLSSISQKSGHGILKEDKNAVLTDLKSGDSDTDQLQCSVKDEDPWTAARIDGGNLACDNEDEVRHCLAPITSPQSSLKTESYERERFFYTDESVVEQELPEMVVFYNGTYDVVKDICVDEGVPSQDGFFFDTVVDEKNVFTFLPPEKDGNSEMLKEGVNFDLPISVMPSSADKPKVETPDVVKSSEEKVHKNNCSLVFNSENIMKTREAKDGAKRKIPNNASKISFSLGELLSMPELGQEVYHHKSYNNSMDEVEQQFLQRQSKHTVIVASPAKDESEGGSEQAVSYGHDWVPGSEKSDCSHDEAVLSTTASGPSSEESDYGKETVSAIPVLMSAAEASKEDINEANGRHARSEELASIITNDLSYNSELDTGNITFDFDSSEPTASLIEDGPQNGEAEHPETQNISGPENINTNSGSSLLQDCNGESSFSAAVPVSGLIGYMGPIAYSGSTSLRSDSSTTSARSFAFPILQSEWNSSPVRMVKADRRHFRKHGGWRQGLLCCKF